MQAHLAAVHEMRRQELFALVHTANKRNPVLDTGAYRSAVKHIRNRFVAKLCDFGSASVQSSSVIGREPIIGHSPCGSRRFACPHVVLVMDMLKRPENAHEIWTDSEAAWDHAMDLGYSSTAADVWSFGMTVFAIVTGHMPFSVASVQDELYRRYLLTEQPHVLNDPVAAPGSPLWAPAVNPRMHSPWKWPGSISAGLQHLLGRCLAVRASERYTVDNILKHPWFEDPTWQPEQQGAAAFTLPPIATAGSSTSVTRSAQHIPQTPARSPLDAAPPSRGGQFERGGKTEDEDGDVPLGGTRPGRRLSNPAKQQSSPHKHMPLTGHGPGQLPGLVAQ